MDETKHVRSIMFYNYGIRLSKKKGLHIFLPTNSYIRFLLLILLSSLLLLYSVFIKPVQ